MGDKPEIKPNQAWFQVFIMILVSCIPVGSYYGMDSPAPIERYIKKSILNNGTELTHSDYMRLYEIYSIPNIFLCFVAGIFIDAKWGRRLGSIICCSVVTVGAFVVAGGAYMGNLILMYLGRFIFGIGSESVALTEYSYNNYWFDKTKIPDGSQYKPVVGLEFAFAIAISFSRGATAIAFKTLPRFYRYFAGVDEQEMQQQTQWYQLYN